MPIKFKCIFLFSMVKAKIALLLLLLALVHSQNQPLSIIYVSSQPGSNTSPVYSSLRGGRMIYIKAIGHSPVASNNQVFVGFYPCIIPSDGVTDTFISCETSDTGLVSDTNAQPVTLISYGNSFTTSYPNVVYYQNYYTPFLNEIYPSSGFAGLNVNFQGLHTISNIGDGLRDMGDITKIKLGNDLCSRFGVEQAPIQPYWSNQYVRCVESSQQEAGLYNVTEQVVNGYSNNSQYLRRSSLIPGQYFQFSALPTVSSVSPNSGNIGGQFLSITGTGFSRNPANNTVSVDGTNCAVTSASENLLTCTLSKRDSSKTTLLPTNSTSQKNGYFAGAGLQYARYTYSGTLPEFISGVRAANLTLLGSPLEVGFRAELKQGDVYGTYYSQTWKGYFTAPVSGNYTFRGLSDDIYSFYLAQTYGSTELPTTPLISSPGYQIWNEYYINDYPTSENWAMLVKGQSYYLQAYHMNYAGAGYFNIQVEVPNTDPSLSFQTYQVDQVVLNSTVQPETITYSMKGGSSGTISLRIYRINKATGLVSYDVTSNITYGCSATAFVNALNNFNSFKPYVISATRNIYDALGNVLSSTTNAVQIDYIVSIYLLRPADYISEKFLISYVGYTGTFSQGTQTVHSPIITGFFKLYVGGFLVDPYGNGSLPFNANSYDIQTFLRSRVVGFESVEVSLGYVYGCAYNCTWFIKYKGYNGQITNSSTVGLGLQGGSASVTISTFTRRSYSRNVVFSPIDYRFLNTVASSGNVIVSTNNIPSVCTGNCGYTFSNIAQISSISYSGIVLTVGITDTTSIGFTASQISITVGGYPCAITNANLAALTCNMKTNSDSSALLISGDLTRNLQQTAAATPSLISGSYTPLVVKVGSYGIAALAVGVTGITVPLVVSTISLTSGGSNGGYLVTLTGHGFPLNVNDIQISVCNNLATIKEVNNIATTFYMPACPQVSSLNPTDFTDTVKVTVGTAKDSSKSFTYTVPSGGPIIMSISPASANPGLKGILEINGNNFGNSISAVQVFLSNSSGKVYPLNVISLTTTYIKVGLPGGLPGIFTVKVTLPNSNGDSLPNSAGADTFQYVVSIKSVSPLTGSINGGTLITIDGENFSADTQNTLVFIGTTLNWFCKIQKLTATQILCRTPAISNDYSPGVPQNIVITTRLILESINTTYQFTYLSPASSPSLTNLSVSGTTVTLTGTMFLLGGDTNCLIVFVNTVSGAQSTLYATTCTSTSATFTILSNITSGNYNVNVRNNLGDTNSQPLAVQWKIGNVNYPSGGSTAGAIISLTGGSGYPTDLTNPQFSVTITVANITTPAKIVSCCSNNVISIQIPAAPSGTSFKLTFNGPTNAASPPTKNFISQTSSTSNITVTSSLTIAPGSATITFQKNDSYANPISSVALVSTKNPSQRIPIASWTTNGAITTFSAVLTAGSFSLDVRGAMNFYYCSSVISVQMPANVLTSTTTSTSFNGGIFTIQANHLSPVSDITVNGFKGTIILSDATKAVYRLPAFVTPTTQAAFNLQSVQLLNMGLMTYFSDQSPSGNASLAFDQSITTIYGSNNTNCWIGMDVGSGLIASINRFRFFPYLNWVNTANYTLGATFQGSNDQSVWTTLATIDQTVQSGWNVLVSNSNTGYRYFRFYHNSQSQCNIAEIQLYGILYSNTAANIVSTSSDVIYNDGFNTVPFTNSVVYMQSYTSVVTSISPPYGDIFGGYLLTITGTNLNVDVPQVTIDGIVCANPTAVSSTTITCTVGARPKLPLSNSFTVMIGRSAAIVQRPFLYVLRWSDSRTWGVDQAPIDGDLVYVPQGMTLLVDQSTPKLKGIAINDGTIMFSDEIDMVISSGFIMVNGGKFIAGTEALPYQHQLTFVMYGGYYDAQMPMFGNKGIGCMDCKLSIYGTPRTPTWTTLANSIAVGDTTLKVSTTVDWKIGQEIVVASTSFIHHEAERRTITAVDSGTNTITVNASFAYAHAAVRQTHGTDFLEMRAEVGLLTRNIKMRGDDSSAVSQYGSHLMISGKSINGAEGHVAYAEFSHCGQPQILGRYCIHFHMMGAVPTSYARGNAVHDSFARVVTIHGVHFLTVEQNVGYRVRGHNFFVEDGIETHNIIRNNLAIGSLTVTNMLQTDISVASFWVTNPSNDFYGNHAAGSDFYGIWYEVKPNPDGPSATNDVCPMGNPLGNVHDNVAHSNVRFGLRIFHLYSRMFPCQPIRNNSNANNPWADNPSIQSRFENFTIYKNLEDGVLAENTGHVTFHNFTIAQNYRSGIEFHVSNYTKIPPLVNNSVIIGMSKTNAHSDKTNYTNGMSGAMTGRSGVTNISNVRFYSFPTGSIMFQICVLCDDLLKYTNVGTEVLLSKLTFTDINGSYLFMIGLKRDVIYDLDGSLSMAFDGTARTSGTIVSNWPHIAMAQQDKCPQASDTAGWDNAIMCNQLVSLRRVVFTNLAPTALFKSQYMHAYELAQITDTTPIILDPTLYTSVRSYLPDMEPKVQLKYTYSLPFITGHIYNIWWGSGIDFSHIAVFTSPSYTQNEDGTIFKFNYTGNREGFSVGSFRGGVAQPMIDNLANSSQLYLDPKTCGNGAFYHNNSESDGLRMFSLCQSGKNRTLNQYTNVDAIVCRYLCPSSSNFTKQNFTRIWSNATQWPNGTVPTAGQNVTVNGNWTLILDINPSTINFLIIDGTLIIPDDQDITITANSIFIRAGNLTAGSPSTPFTHQLKFQIIGSKADHGFFINPIIATNKFFVVTGSLNLYGVTPSTVITALTSTAVAGSSTIDVASSSDWQVGDTLALGPSFSTYSEFELVTIASISSNTITLASPLAYTHYGSTSGSTISTTYGRLDTRTRVGHVNRNIQFVPGADVNWGYTVIVHAYNDPSGNRYIGNVQLNGVQFLNGGQLDTFNSPLVFKNVIGSSQTSIVTASSFVNCKAFCINYDTSSNVAITNNVLYNGWVFGLQVIQPLAFTFENNLIIGISEKPTLAIGSELVACIFSIGYINPSTDEVSIQNNVCQGSQAHGYAFAHILCTEIQTNPFANNTVGSANIGFIFQSIGAKCNAFSYAFAYACQIGQISGPANSVALIYSKFIMADNGRGVTLKFGASEGGANHTAYLYDSYISAVSRPSCTECYASGSTSCSGNIGIRMLTASANGQSMPSKFGHGFDVVCKQPVYDNKAYLFNVVFDNFNQVYTGAAASCSSNFAFRPHSGGFDSTASHNLFNCNCTKCDTDSYLYADAPSPSQLGWFGGCGDILCTGRQNYLIQDWNGSFLGFPGTLIPNNSVIGGNEPGCKFSTFMNAYTCSRSDFGVLEYQNIAADFNTRIMWPVNLTYDGSNYTTVTNGWRDWEWIGKQPQNKRFGRFVSIVTLGKTYNMTYAALPPTNLQVELRKRTPLGDNSKYVVIKLHYPKPNSISVSVNKVIVKPILLTDYIVGASVTPGLLQNIDTSLCGSNIYNYLTYTTTFVVTQDANCIVEVTLVDTIQLTTHFAMNISDFFSDSSKMTNFINNLCALLHVTDTSRVKVVGVFSGSTTITTTIEAPSATSTDNATIADTAATVQAVVGSGSFSSTMASGVGTVITTTYAIHLVNDPESSQDGHPPMNIALIVGVTVASVVFLVIVSLSILACARKRARVVDEKMFSSQTFPEQKQEKEGNNSNLYNLANNNSKIYPEHSDLIIRDQRVEVKDIENVDE